VRVNEPSAIAPNYPAFGDTLDQCPASAAPNASSIFDPTNCPPQSFVGTMTINTPLLPTPLTGKVYLITKAPLPWLGVAFDQPGISVRLTGVTSTPQVDPTCDPTDLDTNPLGCVSQISIVFNSLPDVPMTGIQLVLDSPSRTGINNITLPGRILKIAKPGDPSCQPTTAGSAAFTPFSGTGVVTRSVNATVTGC
jgi:hypothetical protein